MSAKNRENFFTAHYDWLAVGVGVAVLALGAYCLLGANGTDPEEAAGEAVAALERGKKGAERVKPADLEPYVDALRAFRKPPTLAALTDAAKPSYLASERRIFCDSPACRMPLRGNATNCVWCGTVLAVAQERVVYDTDKDGLPDVWEQKYGFNAMDAADANADADGDGYTNAEEFEAKTDPKDPKAHPDYLAEVTVPGAVATTLPFYFKGVQKMPGGKLKFEFYDPRKKNDYGKAGYTYRLFAGDKIGDTGFVVKAYEEKREKRQIPGATKGMMREVDVSTATVERTKDRRAITLVKDDKKPVSVDVKAELSFPRGRTDAERKMTVLVGDEISLYGEKYVVREIKRKGKSAEVTLENKATGKVRTLPALES